MFDVNFVIRIVCLYYVLFITTHTCGCAFSLFYSNTFIHKVATLPIQKLVEEKRTEQNVSSTVMVDYYKNERLWKEYPHMYTSLACKDTKMSVDYCLWNTQTIVGQHMLNAKLKYTLKGYTSTMYLC